MGQASGKEPPENLVYYSSQLLPEDYEIIPGVNQFLPKGKRYWRITESIRKMVDRALAASVAETEKITPKRPVLPVCRMVPAGFPGPGNHNTCLCSN